MCASQPGIFRRFVEIPLLGSVLLIGVVAGVTACDSQGTTEDGMDGDEEPAPTQMVPETLTLSGALQDVHDPAMMKAHGEYALFSTGGGIWNRRSTDRVTWEVEGQVLDGVPEWAENIAEDDLWAPDISFFNGRYHLYYSASTFGSGRSAIGLATNPVLHPDSAAYEWTDQGKVIESFESDPYNAIDPNIVIDDEDRVWMAFGSWNETGIRMRRIDPETGMPSSADETFYQLANRPNADENAVEAPYIIKRDGFYYLFVSFDRCCEGVESTYNVRVGRSENVTGPYVDQDGTPMNEGGGTLIIEESPEWKGPGHNSVVQDEGETLLIYHAYSVQADGTPFLRISPLEWEDGWPFVPMVEAS